MTKRQERIIAVSKNRYPNEGDLEKQLAFIDGCNYTMGENFGFGFFIGMVIITVSIILTLVLCAPKESAAYDRAKAEAFLNSPDWKVDTVMTVINGQDTTRFYKFNKRN